MVGEGIEGPCVVERDGVQEDPLPSPSSIMKERHHYFPGTLLAGGKKGIKFLVSPYICASLACRPTSKDIQQRYFECY